jgi:hypothetical protein
VLRWPIRGADRYVTLDQAFSFEQESAYKVTDGTREKLLAMIPQETFAASCCPCKIVLNDIEAFVRVRSIDLCDPADLKALRERIGDACMSGAEMVDQLVRFCHTEPRLPTTDVRFTPRRRRWRCRPTMTRDEVIAHVSSLRVRNVTADMAFYAWRDLARTPAAPFIKAAMEATR